MACAVSNLDPIAQAAFERGQIVARLDEHDRRFQGINGSQARAAESLAKIEMTVQRLADQAEAREATVITTAAALKAAEETRAAAIVAAREKSEQSWTPLTRMYAATGVLASIAAIVGSLFLIFH